MNQRTIKVTIEGHVGVGKSKLMLKVMDMLRAEGVQVEHNIDEGLERPTKERAAKGMVLDNVKVKLVERVERYV